MNETRPVSHLVVVGSSAGGIEALLVLVSSLPEDFPAPIVLAQHLDPTRASQLDQILQRRSKLPVRVVADRESLEAGIIYVVPSNQHVSISDHDIELVDGSARPMPSVDLLLSSASDSFGDSLIAVILTGTGSDGANGARIVHEAGGVVIIQNPEGADFPSMPRSLAPNTVDLIADLDRIGPSLSALLSGMVPSALADDRQRLELFLGELSIRFGMDFSSYKTPTIRRRLQRRIVATDSGDLDNYIHYLDSHPEEYAKLLDSFLIKVTQFFRDPDLFTFLRERILPDLIEQGRGHNHEIRIWSAGCATGEEAYSLGIVLAEMLGEDLDLFDVRIFATDADPGAIAYARVGAYPARAIAEVPDDIVARYFTNDAGTYFVRKRVRSLIVFGEHDLGRRAPFPRIDLVMCRNVLIYFTAQLQEHVLRSFAYSLQDHGHLILGKAETTSPVPDYFEVEESRLRIYRRRGERIVMPSTLSNPFVKMYSPPARLPAWMGNHPSNNRQMVVAPPPSPSLASNDFLLSFPLGVVVIDRSYDIHAINATARRLLSIHTAAIGEDLIHSARHLHYDDIRDVIDSAFRDRAHRVIAELSVDDIVTGESRFLKLTCYPLGEQGPPELVSIIVDDVTDTARERRTLISKLEESHAERDRISRGANEQVARMEKDAATEHAALQRQTDRVRGINREITDANRGLTQFVEELRVRNEELMLMTEESQAANEEVETLNEELQATNEELETLNEELQATVEELNTTNEELQSRGNEMREVALTREGERARLEVILGSMTDAVIAVDRAGRAMPANEAARQLFGTPAGEEGWFDRSVLLDPNGRKLTADEMPRHLASRGEHFKTEFTILTNDGNHHFFEATGGPIGIGGEVEGGVIVVRDITDRSLRKLQDEFLSLASHELRNPLTVLQSYLQLLLRQLNNHPEDTETLRSRVDIALIQTHQLGRLVSDLINTTRLQNGRYQLELEPVRLDSLVAQSVEQARPLAQGQRIEFEADGPMTVAADAGRLEQVVLNLLRNAITYAPNTERIEVRMERIDGCARIEVIDHGSGIAASDIPHLFTRFYQVKRSDRPARGGLGLGLYISKQIVEAHEGRIEVSSAKGQGTTFRVFLPLMEPQESGEAQ